MNKQEILHELMLIVVSNSSAKTFRAKVLNLIERSMIGESGTKFEGKLKQKIIERDQFTCLYCGEIGNTELGALSRRDGKDDF